MFYFSGSLVWELKYDAWNLNRLCVIICIILFAATKQQKSYGCHAPCRVPCHRHTVPYSAKPQMVAVGQLMNTTVMTAMMTQQRRR